MEYIELKEEHIGKLVSLNYHGVFYKECLVILEGKIIYLLNNEYSNNDGHSDKSKYKYSLKFFSFECLNISCSNIQLLEPEKVKEWSVGTYVVFLEDNLQYNSFKKGEIKQIIKSYNGILRFEGSLGNNISGETSVADKIKWFATKEEAEEFSKSLFEDISDIKELSIEEVQQYLPDGHPDKLENKIEDENVLEDWLKETKNKNLSLNDLEDYINFKTPTEIYIKLEGKFSGNKAKILYEKWNKCEEKEEIKKGDNSSLEVELIMFKLS